MMKAIVISKTGGTEELVLLDVAEPDPGPDGLLVEVDAAGVNYVDTYHRSGFYDLTLPFVPGLEGGGTVAAEALRARAVDRVVLFLAPALLGGDGVPAIGQLGVRRVARAVRVEDVAVGRVGDDLVLEGRIRYVRR